MNSLPPPIPFLIFVSLGLSVTLTAFALAALGLSASPLLWSLPIAFAAGLFYHIVILSLARAELHSGSTRLFSASSIVWAFIIAVLWTLCTCATITATVLKSMNVFPKYEMRVGIWLLIICAVLALLESGITWTIAIFCRKERKKITYAAKWRPLAKDFSWSLNLTPSWT